MAIEKLSSFRNITYDYKNDNDVFIGRGLHLNMINDTLSAVIDTVNTGVTFGNQYEIPVSNAAGDGYDYSVNLTFDGSTLMLGGGGELDQYGLNILLGGDTPTDGLARTDATGKAGRILIPHYTNAEENFLTMQGLSSSSNSTVYIGGGNTQYNAATRTRIIAAPNTNTLTGTAIVNIDIAGLQLLNGAELDQIGEKILLGSDAASPSTRTDGVTKAGRIVLPHVTESEEGIALISGRSGTNNYVYIGGGSSNYNAATMIRFITAEDQTTVSGTLMATMDPSGLHVDSISELTTSAGITLSSNVKVSGDVFLNNFTIATNGQFLLVDTDESIDHSTSAFRISGNYLYATRFRSDNSVEVGDMIHKTALAGSIEAAGTTVLFTMGYGETYLVHALRQQYDGGTSAAAYISAIVHCYQNSVGSVMNAYISVIGSDVLSLDVTNATATTIDIQLVGSTTDEPITWSALQFTIAY